MAVLSRIAPEIPVSDLKEAIRYYTQKLGFEVAMELPERDYAILERDGVAIHLFQADVTAGIGVHIFTPDLEELHNELQGRGATISKGITFKP